MGGDFAQDSDQATPNEERMAYWPRTLVAIDMEIGDKVWVFFLQYPPPVPMRSSVMDIQCYFAISVFKSRNRARTTRGRRTRDIVDRPYNTINT